jgi:hypothetical protein
MKKVVKVSILVFYLLPLIGFGQTHTPLFPIYKNQVKLGVQEIFMGDLSGYYERVLSKKVAVEFGAGVVLRNYLREFVQETVQPESRRILLGMSMNAGIKYYPFIPGEAMYLSMDYKVRRYRTQYKTVSTIGNETLIFNEFDQKNIFRLGIGYMYCLDDHAFLDFYSGVGLAGLTNQSMVPQMNPNTNEWEFIKSRTYDVKLHFNVGLKFGYRF